MSQTVIAVAEACKELGKPIVDTGCDLLKSLFGKPFEVAGEMISDELYRWQWARRLESLEKASRVIEQRGLAARVIPKGFFLSFLQSAGEIENPELQQLWANLLASAVETDSAQHPGFVPVLKQLSVVEARVFTRVGSGKFSITRTTTETFPLKYQPQENPLSVEVIYLGIDGLSDNASVVMTGLSHLCELGLITVEMSERVSSGKTSDTCRTRTGNETCKAMLTSFGAAFYAACISNVIPANIRILDNWDILRDVRSELNRTSNFAIQSRIETDKELHRIEVLPLTLR